MSTVRPREGRALGIARILVCGWEQRAATMAGDIVAESFRGYLSYKTILNLMSLTTESGFTLNSTPITSTHQDKKRLSKIMTLIYWYLFKRHILVTQGLIAT